MMTSLTTFIRRYFLSILTAKKGLDTASIKALSQGALRQGTFVRALPESDVPHWDDVVIIANADQNWLDGEISPGPDYRLYLIPKYVERGAEFLQIMGRLKRLKILRSIYQQLLRSAIFRQC